MKHLIALMLVAASGPVSKFDSKAPLAEYDSVRKLEDVERCLLDMSGQFAPTVYRQPDRPDDVMLLWSKPAEAAGITAFRLDLHRTPAGTHVRSWMPAKQVAECAPKAG